MLEYLNRYKNYYILTEGISNFGGAQLLVLRRAKFLKSKGFNVKIIVSRHRGEFILEKEFQGFPILYIPELDQPLFKYSNKRISNILNSISIFLYNHNDSIIETNSLQSSVWGELVAKKNKYKHIIYLFSELKIKNYLLYPGLNYFLFKYKRGELFGCSRKSLEIIFGKYYDASQNNFINVSFDSEEIKEKTIPSVENYELLENSKTILTVSRLEKEYVEYLIEDVIKIAKKNPQININLIVGGGTIFNEIKNKFDNNYLPPKLNLPNLRIIFTGYIKVLGVDLFRLTDVFVGMGTASLNSISQKCATLVVNPFTNKTPGILGIHTTTFGYPDNNIEYNLDELIESLLFDYKLLDEAKNNGYELYESSYKTDSCFNKFDDLVSKSNQSIEYYNYNIILMRRFSDFIIYLLKISRRKLKTIIK